MCKVGSRPTTNTEVYGVTSRSDGRHREEVEHDGMILQESAMSGRAADADGGSAGTPSARRRKDRA